MLAAQIACYCFKAGTQLVCVRLCRSQSLSENLTTALVFWSALNTAASKEAHVVEEHMIF